MGVALGALPTVIAEAGAPSRTGIASALYNDVKALGGAVAWAVIAVILATPAPETEAAVFDAAEAASESGYVAVWLLCALLSLGAAGAAACARRTGTG
ncbi:hypothetical protein [Streptomyces sp. A1277]|uniref:hypothetical protein n=1 Tax=Streptomyces sp. A1277 TaxID=2563103 RepID=UPI001F0D69C3|nr:hypothetical protein [Streptomyces sp. A1277]